MAMEINAANIKNIFAGKLSETQSAAIDKAAEDGVLTANEIAELKTTGVDTDVIAQNFQLEDAEKVGEAAAPTATAVNVPAEFANDPQIQALQAKINQNNVQIAANKLNISVNNNQIDKIKAEMEALADEAKKEIENAIAESEQIAAEQKDAAAAAVDRRMNAFTAANGEMSYSDFKRGLSSDLDGIAGQADSALSRVIGNMLDANDKLGRLDGMLQNIKFLLDENAELTETNNNLSAENTKLSADISSRVSQLQAEKAAEEARRAAEEERRRCEEEERRRCDPIGFEANGQKFDFFVDADGNGDLSNASEFLGAEDGWAAMAALDTDGDGKVTGAEMDAAGLKMVVSGKDGSQKVINASELFNEANEGIDLGSYQEVNKDVNKDVRLLGNFEIELNDFGGDSIEGYNTLDSLSYLNENYKFTDNNMSAEDAAKIAGNTDNKYVAYTAESIGFEDMENSLAELHSEWEDAWTKIGMKSDSMESVRNLINRQGETSAKALDDKFKDYKKKAEAEEAAQAEADEAAQVEAQEAEAQKAADVQAEEAAKKKKEQTK